MKLALFADIHSSLEAIAACLEHLTYHVLEWEKPPAALVDYAKMNDVDQILIGASRSGAPTRLFPGVAAKVVAAAPCSVTVVRPRPQS